MIFDSADLEDDGTLKTVFLHEMGHVLGIGNLWRSIAQGGATPAGDCSDCLLQDPFFLSDGNGGVTIKPSENPQFIGYKLQQPRML